MTERQTGSAVQRVAPMPSLQPRALEAFSGYTARSMEPMNSDEIRKGSRVGFMNGVTGTVTAMVSVAVITVRPDFQPNAINVSPNDVSLVAKSSKKFRVLHGDACNYAGDADSLLEAITYAMPLGHFSVWEIEENGPRKVAVKEEGSPVRFLKEHGSKKPHDMTTGRQWKFRVGDLRYLETYLDKSALDGAIDGLASLHQARKHVGLLSQQMTIQLTNGDGTLTDNADVFLHAMTYDKLRLAWLHLAAAADTVANAMNWIATGKDPLAEKPNQ